MTKTTVFALNGPNLNLTGQREPAIYGRDTLDDIEAGLREYAESIDFHIDFRQSNHEGEIVDWLHEAQKKAQGVILNAGAYSHQSYAIADALAALTIPKIEVHLSNIHARESFRRRSVTAAQEHGVIAGFKGAGYRLALDAVAALLEEARSNG